MLNIYVQFRQFLYIEAVLAILVTLALVRLALWR
jgi:hypothetical protein